MPDGKNKDYLKKEIARKIFLAKIYCTSKGKDLLDSALEDFNELIKGDDDVLEKSVKKDNHRGFGEKD